MKLRLRVTNKGCSWAAVVSVEEAQLGNVFHEAVSLLLPLRYKEVELELIFQRGWQMNTLFLPAS